MPCMVVATPQQKASLRQLFMNRKQTLIRDHQSLRSASQALNEAILSGSKNLASQEAAVGKAQQQLLHDRDALATEFCGQLSQTQRGAESGHAGADNDEIEFRHVATSPWRSIEPASLMA